MMEYAEDNSGSMASDRARQRARGSEEVRRQVQSIWSWRRDLIYLTTASNKTTRQSKSEFITFPVLVIQLQRLESFG
jgi:hypothetical protein